MMMQKFIFKIIKMQLMLLEIGNSNEQHSISIKLSALHPRYERNKLQLLNKELMPKLLELIEIG